MTLHGRDKEVQADVEKVGNANSVSFMGDYFNMFSVLSSRGGGGIREG